MNQILLILMLTSTLLGNSLRGQQSFSSSSDSYRIIVKFSSEAVLDFDDGKPLVAPTVRSVPPQATNLIDKHRFTPLISFNEQERVMMRSGITPPPQKGALDLQRLRGLSFVDGAEELSKDEAMRLAKELETIPFVEYAALEPVTPPAPPQTPDFTHLQFYRKHHHNGDTIGINIDYAWSQGIFGQGVRVADIEWGFDYNHEDLKRGSFVELISTTNNDHDDHGTAVAGIMYAKNNDFGVTGMVHAVDTFYGVSEIRHGRTSGILEGLKRLRAGDVFVYEMQTGGWEGDDFGPADLNQAVWDVTKTATDAGIIVVAAAGNGRVNLDAPHYAPYHARGDNGSIIVGAGTINGRNRAGFSTYGERIDAQGWGDWSVTTTGYGGLYNGGPNSTYTSTFSGTSAATPIVASAVVAIQSYAINNLGRIIEPREMRELLRTTGTPGGSGWGDHTPKLPDVQAAIEALRGEEERTRFSIELNSIDGTISATPLRELYDSAQTITLTALPQRGYTFYSWSGDLSGGENPISLTIERDLSIEAIFIVADSSKLYIPPQVISISSFSSEETVGEDGRASNILDESSETIWHSKWTGTPAEGPHEFTLELDEPRRISAFEYTPRASSPSANGNIKDFAIFIGDSLNWDNPHYVGTLPLSTEATIVDIEPVTGRFIRFVALSSQNGADFAACAQFALFEDIRQIEEGEVSLAEINKSVKTTIFGNKLIIGESFTGGEIAIFNIRGQIIDQRAVRAGESIELKNMSSGLYLVKIREKGLGTEIKRFLR